MNIKIFELGENGFPYAKIDEQDVWYVEVTMTNGLRLDIRSITDGIVITAKDGTLAVYPKADNQIVLEERR